LHTDTFVYWNGDAAAPDSRLRSFMVEPELVQAVALKAGAKAEAHRLGYEMSEDALTWNVFVSLAIAGQLREAAHILTGRRLSREPTLYLWGKLIDPTTRHFKTFEPLDRVRSYLENGIAHFLTEPDIMLVVEGEMLICIEAKFGSGNPLAYEAAARIDVPKAKFGGGGNKKPTSRNGLIERYFKRARKPETAAAIRPQSMTDTLHSQLFRNVVFASEMADKEWHVVNLVCDSARIRQDNSRYAFSNPTPHVCNYLAPDVRHCFTYRTWEQLYRTVIQDNPRLATLKSYFEGKSAHYRQAFDLKSAPLLQAGSP
jgi:hypothetical protein